MAETVCIEPLRRADLAVVAELARAIWREHYVAIIGAAQVEYMLRDKYTVADLARYVDAPGRWFEVLRVDGRACGFLRCALAGNGHFKLEEIYLEQAQRGKALGQLLLQRAEALARAHGCSAIFLYVNRANERAVAAYRSKGFLVTESLVIDIGQGFVMDDHRMEMALDPA